MPSAQEIEAEALGKKKINRSFNILSLDGGGVRGTLQAVIVDRIQKEHYSNFLRDTDLITGVSTGGIQALGLAAGTSTPEVRGLYEKSFKYIFADSLLDDFRDAWKLTGADYSNKNLRKLLRLQFGDMCLRDLNKKVAIVAFDLDNEVTSIHGVRTWKPKVFHNFSGSDSDGDELVVDVALRTSAAPTFFPTYQGYCDGAFASNNPALVGIAVALDDRCLPRNKYSLEHLKVLSIGTGRTGRYIKGKNLDWGVGQWAPKLVSLMMEAPVQMVDFQCQMLLKENYRRINPILGKAFSLDCWKKVPEMVKIAEDFNLKSTQDWLEERWL
jgi:patatin-like phospholipase/acyl hydrolase